MNAIAKAEPRSVASISDDDAIQVLQNSLYPGARPESVRLVLAWCHATGRDPMKKPIHIVPMWVKDAASGQGGMRDVLMPGIGTYRSDAASTGQYAGKTEPEFGPDVDGNVGSVRMTYPRWCKVTVQRLVAGQVRSFTAMEYWLENYATAGRNADEPNAMWRKRPYGQLAKCAESQALRMAFPDETGGTNTIEEMEGKTFDGPTIDAERPTPPVPAQARPPATLQTARTDHREAQQAAATAQPAKKMTIAEFLDTLDRELDMAPEAAAVEALMRSTRVSEARSFLTNGAAARLAAWTTRAEEKRQALIDDHAEAVIPAAVGSLLGDMPDDMAEWPLAGEEHANA